MDDKPLTGKQFEEIMRRAGMLGGGGVRRASAGGDAGQAAEYLTQTLEDTEKSLRQYKTVQQDYNKRQQAGSFVAGLFGKSTEAASKNMAQLQRAISQHEQALEELTAQGYTAKDQKFKEVQGGLKMLQSQEQMYRAQSTGAEIIRNASGQIFQTFLNLGRIQAQYQAELLGIVQQGGSGFQMAAAAMTNAVEQMHAMQSTMAQIAQSAGQSLGQLGGKFAPLAGMALTALGHAAQAAADAQRTLAQAQIRIMAAEGDKLIKTHHELTNTGVIYANGMKGLINATAGTKLRLEEMSAVINKNRDSFAAVGIGMSAATDLIGGVVKRFAATTGQFAKMDKQLLALGFSYQEQAELAAETASMLSLGGRATNEKEVAQATVEMAKSMRIVAEVSGIDLAEKKKAIQAQQQEFFIKGQMAKMARDEPEKYKQFTKQLLGMSEQHQKVAYQMQFYGTVVDKNLAIQMATNSGFRKIAKENDHALRTGQASEKQALETRQKYGKEEMDQAINLSGTIGKAANALGTFSDVAKNMADSMTETQAILKSDIPKAIAAVDKQMREAAKPTDKTDPTALLLDAVEKGALAAKLLQEKVISKLPALSAAMTKAFQDAIDALDGKGAGGTGTFLDKLLQYLPILTAALTALTLVQQMFPGKLSGLFAKLKGAPPGMPGSGSDKPSLFQKAKEKFFPKKELSANDAYLEKMNRQHSPTKMQKVSDALGKAGEFVSKHAGKLAVVGNLINVGFAAKETFDKQKEYEAAKAAGDQEGMDAARAEQGKAVGGATGAIIGTALGAIGGPLGMAIGGYLGNEIGGMLGEYAGPYWDTMTNKLGQWGDALGKGSKQLWTSASSWASSKFTEASNWVKKSTSEFLAEHPKLAAAVAKFPKSFDEAGKLAKGLLLDTQAKFKAEFPKLYANLETTFKTIGSFTSGLMDSIGEKWRDAKTYIANKLGLGGQTQPTTTSTAAPATTSATPAAGTPSASPASAKPSSPNLPKDAKLIRDYAYSIYKGKQQITDVPKHLQNDVLAMLKSPPADFGQAYATSPTSKPKTEVRTAPATAGVPVTPSSKPPTTPTTAGVPTKQTLTASEKANAMETVAVNTKYTNDLIISNQRNLESLVKAMITRLDSVVAATEATAGYGKKTARNTA